MNANRLGPTLLTFCAVLFASSSQIALAATLCVNPAGSGGCYKTISLAVSHAAAYDVINVWPGTYKEDVIIGIPLSILGSGAKKSVIDATGFPDGVFVDGYDHAGLSHVTVAGFTVENAQFEGVLVVSASDITIRDNTIENNDKVGPMFTGATVGCPASQPLKPTRPATAAAAFISSVSGTRSSPATC